MIRNAIAVILFCGAGLMTFHGIFAGEYDPEGIEPFPKGHFIEPGQCAICHGDIHEMWDGSLHSKALKDPLFIAATKLFYTETDDQGERADAEHCVACHNPIAFRSGLVPGSSSDYSKATGPSAFSISCDLCHSVDEIVEVRNAYLNTDPGTEDEPGIKRGPREGAVSSYHESEYSDIHTSSVMCGVCHNVTHLSHLTKLEGTYDEWYDSPYNVSDPSKRVTCQDCHMRQTPGNPSTGMTERPDYPGESSVMMGVERPHIWRHTVVGGNAFTPRLFGRDDLADMAVERLENAAVLEVFPAIEAFDGALSFTVRVRNEGAGHMLPTGVTEYRQMWLAVEVSDADGQIVYTSGILLDNGTLPAGTRLYNTVFGDVDGNPTINVAKAAVMLTDKRIPPKGWVDETFVIPGAEQKMLTIRATLNYRSADPAVVAALLGEKHDVPVVVMAEIEEIIR